MSYFLAQIIVVANNGAGDDTFLSQILVLVVLAVVVVIGSLVKARANRLKEQQQYYPEGIHSQNSWCHRQIKAIKGLKDKCFGIFFKTAQPRTVTEGPVFDLAARCQEKENKVDEAGERDLGSGMEMLKLDFLLSVIEKTESDGENDVVMRKLSFNELLRRGQLCAADSKTLKIYAINEGNLYGKDIQCGAMKELAERTGLRSNYGFELNEGLQESTAGEPSSGLRLGIRPDEAMRCS